MAGARSVIAVDYRKQAHVQTRSHKFREFIWAMHAFIYAACSSSGCLDERSFFALSESRAKLGQWTAHDVDRSVSHLAIQQPKPGASIAYGGVA